MKFTIIFKDPNAINDAIEEANLIGNEYEKAKEICKKFFKYGEYVDIEIDMEKGTAKVLPIIR